MTPDPTLEATLELMVQRLTEAIRQGTSYSRMCLEAAGVPALLQERDDLRRRLGLHVKEHVETARQRDALIEALRKYGRHTDLCSVTGGYEYPCTCGLTEALGGTDG